MKDAIKELLQKGLSVTAPYKKNMADWCTDVKIYAASDGHCNIYGERFYEKFDNIDDGVDYFVKTSLSSKNLGYILMRLARKGLITPDEIETNWDKKASKFDMTFKEYFDKLVSDEKKLIKQENKEDKNEENSRQH